jgi:hypothetical protein
MRVRMLVHDAAVRVRVAVRPMEEEPEPPQPQCDEGCTHGDLGPALERAAFLCAQLEQDDERREDEDSDRVTDPPPEAEHCAAPRSRIHADEVRDGGDMVGVERVPKAEHEPREE